jgi:hypothetical protein
MEAKEHDRKWHPVRNDNGEWISDENVVFLTKQETWSLQIKARLHGKKWLYSKGVMENCGVINMNMNY